MHSLKHRALALVLTLSMLTGFPALAADPVPTRAESAGAAAEAALTYGGATSVQYALWQDGKITLEGSAGAYSRTENRALTGDTLYGIGSVSKMYTTAAMMKLVEQGKVGLDRPVTAYLPDFKMADARYKKITVRMLLNHSSGLMGTTSQNAFLLNDPDEDDAAQGLLARLATQTLQADPGAYSVYCNDGFTLAELVVERVSGLSFTDFIHRYLTAPAGLNATFTPRDDFDRARLAKTYLGEDTRALPAETLGIIGTGGIYATASDLAAFGGALCSDTLLRASSRAAMANNEAARGMWPADSANDALNYGLGWDSVSMFPFGQSGVQALVKGGDTLFYHAGLVVLPAYNMAAAVLSSGGASTYNELAAARMLIDALAEQGVTVNEAVALPAAEKAEMPAELAALSGLYGTSTAVYNVYISKDGNLTLAVGAAQGGGAQTFAYHSDGTFRDETGTIAVRLLREKNGQVYLYQMGYGAAPGLTAMSAGSYLAERLPAYTVDEAVQSTWDARANKMYLITEEKYTSAMYALGGVFALMPAGFPEGYLLTNQLADAETAVPVLQIPGVGSRDSGVIRCYAEDGVEYLDVNGARYIDAASVGEIYPGAASSCSILENGETRWTSVGKAAGKTMTVTIEGDGAFYVYDQSFALAGSSWVYGDRAVTLPEGGLIAFAGEPGARFALTMQ